MDEYTPNSHKFKEESKVVPEEKKKIEKVVTGAVKTKKKSGLSKFADNFISEDAKNVKSYICTDVLIPAAKKAISDIVTDGISMILYGGTGRKKSSSVANVSYRSYYDRDSRDRYAADNPRTRTGYNYDDIVLESRGEAEEVIRQMMELVETYDVVSVADLYDLVGMSSQYTDNNYGWTNVRNAEVVRVRDGYMLKLPKVLPIK